MATISKPSFWVSMLALGGVEFSGGFPISTQQCIQLVSSLPFLVVSFLKGPFSKKKTTPLTYHRLFQRNQWSVSKPEKNALSVEGGVSTLGGGGRLTSHNGLGSSKIEHIGPLVVQPKMCLETDGLRSAVPPIHLSKWFPSSPTTNLTFEPMKSYHRLQLDISGPIPF